MWRQSLGFSVQEDLEDDVQVLTRCVTNYIRFCAVLSKKVHCFLNTMDQSNPAEQEEESLQGKVRNTEHGRKGIQKELRRKLRRAEDCCEIEGNL